MLSLLIKLYHLIYDENPILIKGLIAFTSPKIPHFTLYGKLGYINIIAITSEMFQYNII